MRLLSPRHLAFLARKARQTPRLRAARKKKLKQRLLDTGTLRAAPAIRSDTLRFDAPEIFSLSKNYEGVAAFLRLLRAEASAPSSRKLLVEMKTIRDLAPAAALALVSELDRWQRMKRTVLRPMTVPDWDPQVRQHLSSMGFFNLLGTRGVRTVGRPAGSAPLSYWLPFTSGTLTDGVLAKRLRARLERHIGSMGDELRTALYRPLIEAMKNAVEHAYPEEYSSEKERQAIGARWWMFGVAESGQRRRIRVIILDQGVTIPGSLPSSWMWSLIAPIILARGDGDSQRIATASEYGRSRHGQQEHRGKGLQDIIALARQHPDNRLRIISRHGYCTVVSNNGMVRHDRHEALNGTLIEWDLNLP